MFLLCFSNTFWIHIKCGKMSVCWGMRRRLMSIPGVMEVWNCLYHRGYYPQSRKTYIVRKQTWPKVHIQCHLVSHDATLQCHPVSSRVPMSHTTFQLQCHPAPHQVPPQCHKCDKTSATRPSLFSTHFLPDKPSTHFFLCKKTEEAEVKIQPEKISQIPQPTSGNSVK